MFTRTVIRQPQLNGFLFSCIKERENGFKFVVVLLYHNFFCYDYSLAELRVVNSCVLELKKSDFHFTLIRVCKSFMLYNKQNKTRVFVDIKYLFSCSTLSFAALTRESYMKVVQWGSSGTVHEPKT